MKRLTETAMFRQLSMESVINPGESALKTMYEDFAHAVIDVCTTKQAEVPAHFTLNFTRLELEQLTLAADAKRVGKKCVIQYLPA